MLTGPTRLCRPCLPAEPAHAAATAGFSILEGEIPGETDCLLEGTGFEPSVPLLRKALLSVANRIRRHERRSRLKVQVRDGDACLEWAPHSLSLRGGTASSNASFSTRESANICVRRLRQWRRTMCHVRCSTRSCR